MKKYILASVIVILSAVSIFSTICSIKYKNQLKEKNEQTYTIDKELEQCTSKNFMTEGMNNCTYQGIEAWNKEIATYSEQLKKYLDKENIQLFDETQKSWEKYYNKEQDFLNKTIAQQDGDIHTTYVVGDMYEITKQRALLIKSFLSQKD